MAAVKCRMCNKKTKDTDGLCYLHKGAVHRRGARSPQSLDLSVPVPAAGGEGSSSDVRDEASENSFAFIDQSYDKDSLVDHGNGVVTGESESGKAMMVFSRISEEDLKRSDIDDSLVDGWYDRDQEDYFSSTFEVESDSEVADEIRDNAQRPDFRSWAVGYKGGVDNGYSYTNDHGRYISRHIESERSGSDGLSTTYSDEW